MKLTYEKRVCKTLKELPQVQELSNLQRGIKLNIVFGPEIFWELESVIDEWCRKLPGFHISKDVTFSGVNISKLPDENAILKNIDFFTSKAAAYERLASQLIQDLAKYLHVKINEEFPIESFNDFRWGRRPAIGTFNEWKYEFHDFYCRFTHLKHGQCIEVPLVFGKEFGVLDPFFFCKFIETSDKIQPMPVPIYNYWDMNFIFKIMLRKGHIEMINSNFDNFDGFILSERNKRKVKIVKMNSDKDTVKKPALLARLKSYFSRTASLW